MRHWNVTRSNTDTASKSKSNTEGIACRLLSTTLESIATSESLCTASSHDIIAYNKEQEKHGVLKGGEGEGEGGVFLGAQV